MTESPVARRSQGFTIERPNIGNLFTAVGPNPWPDIISPSGTHGRGVHDRRAGKPVYIERVHVEMAQHDDTDAIVVVTAYGVQRKKDGTPGKIRDRFDWGLNVWHAAPLVDMPRWIFDLVNERVCDFLAGDVVTFEPAVPEWAEATAGVTE